MAAGISLGRGGGAFVCGEQTGGVHGKANLGSSTGGVVVLGRCRGVWREVQGQLSLKGGGSLHRMATALCCAGEGIRHGRCTRCR
jgi:hypothetical protein